MTPKIFRDGRWQNLDASDPTYSELKEISANLYAELKLESDRRYSHCEIEAACGGETALAVRQKVMARRKSITVAAMPNEKS
jgi:hypothetical protein